MTVDEHVITKIISEDVEATISRFRETIRVRELAATDRLDQMRRLLIFEEREFGFDYVEIAAKMDATCSNSKYCFCRNMMNRRRLHTPDEFTLERRVNAERLRLGIIFS